MSRLIPLIDAIIREDMHALVPLASKLPPDELNSALLRCFMFSNDPAVVTILLNAGANINHQDHEGRTAVFLAVKYMRIDVIQLLITRKCDVNLGKHNQSNCLHLAARHGCVQTIRLLLDAGHQHNVTNWGGNTAVLIACRFGRTEAVESLLTAGCDVSIPNKLGHYPLHYAAFTGDVQLVSLLLAHGANADVRTHLGITPIMLACERKHCAVVEILATRCDLVHQERLYGGNVLHWAIASGCCACVRHLIHVLGSSSELTDLSGRTPLLQAVQSRHPDVIELILNETNIDLSRTSVNSMALHLAAFSGHRSCVEVLCRHKKTRHLVNVHDCFSDTPLDLATKVVALSSLSKSAPPPPADILDVIDILLQQGADWTRRGTRVRSPRFPNVDIDQLGSFVMPIADIISSTSQDILRRAGTAMSNLFSGTVDVNSNADLLGHEDCSCSSHDPKEENADSLLQNMSSVSLKDGNEHDSMTLSSRTNSERTDIILQPSLLFKTYSPVKMALISMLKSASCEQMVAPVRFDFSTWLDTGPEAFVLKVTSLDMTDWLFQQTHTAWPLRELCRGAVRLALGYRTHEKVRLLPLPVSLKNYLNMTELEEIDTRNICIRSTGSYDDVDVE